MKKIIIFGILVSIVMGCTETFHDPEELIKAIQGSGDLQHDILKTWESLLPSEYAIFDSKTNQNLILIQNSDGNIFARIVPNTEGNNEGYRTVFTIIKRNKKRLANEE